MRHPMEALLPFTMLPRHVEDIGYWFARRQPWQTRTSFRKPNTCDKDRIESKAARKREVARRNKKAAEVNRRKRAKL